MSTAISADWRPDIRGKLFVLLFLLTMIDIFIKNVIFVKNN